MPPDGHSALDDDGGFFETVEEFASEADLADWDDDLQAQEPLPPEPRRKKRRSPQRKTRGRRRPKTSQKRTILLSALAVGLFLLLFIGGTLFLLLPRLQGQGAVGNRLRWLPNDTQTYVEIQVAEVWEAPVCKPLRVSHLGQELKKQLLDRWNLQIEEVETLVFGIPAGGGEPVLVIRTIKPIFPDQWTSSGKSSRYAGKTIYQNEQDGSVTFLPESHTIVTGPEEQMLSSIDRNGVCSAEESFQFLRSQGDVIVASTSPQTLPHNMLRQIFQHPMMDAQDIQAVDAVFEFRRDLSFTVTLQWGAKEAARSAYEEANSNLQEALQEIKADRKNFGNTDFLMSRQQRSMTLKMESVLKSLSFNLSESAMTTSGSLPVGLVEDLFQLLEGSESQLLPPVGRGIGNPF